MTFLNRCIHHKMIPKFLQIKSPLPTRCVNNITNNYRRQLLLATKNDTKRRYYQHIKRISEKKEYLKDKLSVDHYNTVLRITESSREKKFLETKNKLKNKFELLYSSKYKKEFTSNGRNTNETIKDCVLNLADSVIPKNQKELLNLGPKFAIASKNIPYMDIITTTEVEALSLEKQDQFAKAELLRQEVKIILFNAKQPRSNLNKEQQEAIKSIKADPNIDIYPFDKGNGFVRLSKEQTKIRMTEGISNTKILNKDPTNTHLKKSNKY